MTFESPDEALQWWAHQKHRSESLAAFDPVAMRGRQFSDVCEHCGRRAPVVLGLRRGSGELVGRCHRCSRERHAETVYILRGQVDAYQPDRAELLVEVADVELALEAAETRSPSQLLTLRWYVLGGLSMRDLVDELRGRGVVLTLWGVQRAVREGRAVLASALAARGLLSDPERWTKAPRWGGRVVS